MHDDNEFYKHIFTGFGESMHTIYRMHKTTTFLSNGILQVGFD